MSVPGEEIEEVLADCCGLHGRDIPAALRSGKPIILPAEDAGLLRSQAARSADGSYSSDPDLTNRSTRKATWTEDPRETRKRTCRARSRSFSGRLPKQRVHSTRACSHSSWRASGSRTSCT